MGYYANFSAIVLMSAIVLIYLWRSRAHRQQARPYALAALGVMVSSVCLHFGLYYPAVILFSVVCFLLVQMAGEPFPDEQDN